MNCQNAVDLHVHSTRSDGTFSPSELVDYAITKHLKAFALTDHDTVGGLEEAISHAQALREKAVRSADMEAAAAIPEVIPGIELSTQYQEKDIHIVGLYVRYQQEAFQNYLKEFVHSREIRNEKMCALLSAHGISVTYPALLKAFPDSVITRAHYAKYLYQKGYVKSIKEAFDRYLGDRCPCFVPREKVTPSQAIRLILDAGGIPVLAHPVLYGMGKDHLDTLTAELKEAGLMAIEAIYSTYTAADEIQIRMLAAKYNLLLSGGSDFHGSNKPGLDLGTGYGKLYVPAELLEKLKAARTKDSSNMSGL